MRLVARQFLLIVLALVYIDAFAANLGGIGDGKEITNIKKCGKAVTHGLHSIQLLPDSKFRYITPTGKYIGQYKTAIPKEKYVLTLNNRSREKLINHIGLSNKSACKVKKKVISPKIRKFIVLRDDVAGTLKTVMEVNYKATNGTDKYRSVYKAVALTEAVDEANLKSGIFIDAPVSGLSYVSPSITGITSDAGVFQYGKGEVISFYLGGLKLGEAVGKSILTPLDLYPRRPQYQAALMSFLQTLDQDGTHENGIHIDPTVGSSIDAYFNIEPGETYSFPRTVEDERFSLLAGYLSNNSEWIDQDDATSGFEAEITNYLENGQYARPLNAPNPALNVQPYYYFTGEQNLPFIVYNKTGDIISFLSNPATGYIQSIIVTDPAGRHLAFFFGDNGVLSGINDGTTSMLVGETSDQLVRLYFMDEVGSAEVLLSNTQAISTESLGFIRESSSASTIISLPTVINCSFESIEDCNKGFLRDSAEFLETVIKNPAIDSIKGLGSNIWKNRWQLAAQQGFGVLLGEYNRNDWVKAVNLDDVVNILVSAGFCSTGSIVSCLEFIINSGKSLYEFLKLSHELLTDKAICNFFPTYSYFGLCQDLAPTASFLSGTKVKTDTVTDITGLGVDDVPTALYPDVCSNPELVVQTPPTLGTILNNQISESGKFTYVSPLVGGQSDQFTYQAVVRCDDKDIYSAPVPVTIHIEGEKPLVLTISTDRDSYSSKDEQITYFFEVTNTSGDVVSGPIRVRDGKLDVVCPDGNIPPGDTMFCEASYTVTQEDIDAVEITNVAFAKGFIDGEKLKSEEASITLKCECGSIEVYTMNGVFWSQDGSYSYLQATAINWAVCRLDEQWIPRTASRGPTDTEFPQPDGSIYVQTGYAQFSINESGNFSVISKVWGDGRLIADGQYSINLETGAGAFTHKNTIHPTHSWGDTPFSPLTNGLPPHDLQPRLGLSIRRSDLPLGEGIPDLCTSSVTQ